MIKAVIFDLDGVIVSTDEYHYQAWKYISGMPENSPIQFTVWLIWKKSLRTILLNFRKEWSIWQILRQNRFA